MLSARIKTLTIISVDGRVACAVNCYLIILTECQQPVYLLMFAIIILFLLLGIIANCRWYQNVLDWQWSAYLVYNNKWYFIGA